ncbi:MAG: hypothetical protein K9M07_01180 [Simkaniaceae bacterium]|nr:hypothetical protein [Simkaniaceae bacterium]
MNSSPTAQAHKPSFIIVSYYTKDTLYEREIQNLARSCQKIGLTIDITAFENQGNWNKNCHFKPFLILEKLKKYQCPIIWLDADSYVHQYPVLFDESPSDFLVRIRDDVDFRHRDKVLSGTVFVKYSPLGINLVETWCEESLKFNETQSDQECLRNAIEKLHLDTETISLPNNYCRIDILDFNQIDSKDIVIEQFQASRLFMKIINQEVCQFNFLDSLSPEELQKIRFSF